MTLGKMDTTEVNYFFSGLKDVVNLDVLKLFASWHTRRQSFTYVSREGIFFRDCLGAAGGRRKVILEETYELPAAAAMNRGEQ